MERSLVESGSSNEYATLASLQCFCLHLLMCRLEPTVLVPDLHSDQLQPNEILFLSDNIQEVQAATWTGMKAIVLERPGNAPLKTEYERSFPIMQALDGVESAKPRLETPSLPYIRGDGKEP